MKSILRIASMLLSLTLICCALSSCSAIEELLSDGGFRGIDINDAENYTSVEKYVFTASPYYTPSQNRNSYYMLEGESERELYDKLVESAYSVCFEPDENGCYNCEQIVIDGALFTQAQIRVAVKAIYDDHPEIFWVKSGFGYLTDKAGNYTAVQLRSTLSPAEICAAAEEIGAMIDEYVAAVPEGLSSYERELKVHDDLIDLCEYNTEVAQAESTDGYEVYYTVCGVFKEHLAVCEGYARAFQLVLDLLGVECVGITGMAQGGEGKEEELHMWNAVKLSGDWYFVDVTWDDRKDPFQRHDYFNLSAEVMNLDHTPSEVFSALSDEQINGDETYSAVAMNMFIPECTRMTYNYIIRECPHLTDFENGMLTDALYSVALDREPYFQFYVDRDCMDMEEAVENLFTEGPQYFFDYIDAVNGMLYDYMIDSSTVSYVCDPVLSYIVVELRYY